VCFSVAGRLQTRLVALVVPALLAIVLSAYTGDPRYYTMLIVMVLVAFDLDLYVYPRLIGYGTRWQTYALGLVEFLITLTIVRVLAGSLPLSTIVWYYLASWIGGQLLVNVLLPILDFQWAEHGGELFRPASSGGAAPAYRPSATIRAWQWMTCRPTETLIVGALLVLTILDLIALPGALPPLTALAAPVGAVLTAWLARRLHPRSVPTIAEALALGLVIGLLVRSTGPGSLLLGGAIAVACRSWLRLGGKPVFNSAACAFVLLVLFVPGVYSGEGQWGNSLLLPLVMANLAVIVAIRTEVFPLVLAFIGVVGLHGWFLAGGHGEPVQILAPQLIPTAVLFFAGFVLPETETSPRPPLHQLVTGAGVALIGVGLQGSGLGLPFAAALLAWNYGVRLVSAGYALLLHLLDRLPGPRSVDEPVARATTRRAFLGSLAAIGGTVFLGGTVRRLTALDPSILSLPPEPVLAGGQAIPRFGDVAHGVGITAEHHGDSSVGSPAVGTGIAWGDYNHDGQLDLYATDYNGPCHLYRNNGDGTFTDIAEGAGVAHPGPHATSATFVDYDNDGWPDLYVGVAYGPNVLYHNNRDGTFTDVSSSSRLADTGRTMSTAWADYDGDRFLDVFVVNYSDNPITFDANSSPIENVRTVRHLPRPQNRLYHNNGDGTFSDVTHLLGDVATTGFGFSAVWFDYNQDGRPDLYVAYDFGNAVQPNTLWRNDGPGGAHGWVFTTVEDRMGLAAQVNAMGVASGDYNNDGWLDLAVSNIGPNMLYRNRAGVRFDNVAEEAGVTHTSENVHNMLNPSMDWGINFADFNNDGWLDLYMVQGSMYFENLPQPNRLFLNDHTGAFIDVSAESGANDSGQGRSVAVADYDGDGYLDLAVANYGQPLLLYRNLSAHSGNNWVGLELEGTRSNRDAVGARVRLFVPGLPPQAREVQIGQGLGSCDAKALHFGLGSSRTVHHIEIRWPSGQVQIMRDVAINRVLLVREPGVSRWSRKGPA